MEKPQWLLKYFSDIFFNNICIRASFSNVWFVLIYINNTIKLHNR